MAGFRDLLPLLPLLLALCLALAAAEGRPPPSSSSSSSSSPPLPSLSQSVFRAQNLLWGSPFEWTGTEPLRLGREVRCTAGRG